MINETWQLAPWADCLYACDARWWQTRGPIPELFGGIRVQGFVDHGKAAMPGLVPGRVDRNSPKMKFSGEGLGNGGNSGFQAINLAVRCGVTRIVLLGFDMGNEGGSHWHGDHAGGLFNPDARFLKSCQMALDSQAPALRALGIEVLNASRRSTLGAYPRVSLDEIFEGGNYGHF